jgi:hypothetical protein
LDRTPSESKQVIDVEEMRDSASVGGTSQEPREEHTEKQRPQAAGAPAAKEKRKEKSVSEELEKLKAEVEANEKIARMRADLEVTRLKAEHETAMQKMQADRDTEKLRADKAEAKVNAAKRADIERFVVARIDKKQIEPASKDSTVEHILGMDEAKGTEYMKLLEKLPLAHVDATLPTTEPDKEAFKDEKTDRAVAEANRIELKAMELQRANPNLSAREAMDKARGMV